MSDKPEADLTPLVDAAVMREAQQGLRETIKIFQRIGLRDKQIAFMFRAMADEIDAPVFEMEAPRIVQ